MYVALDNSIPLEEGEEIPEIPKNPKTPVQKTEPEIFSEFMIAFAKRFPFFLNIPRKFYTPFRQFITNLEDIYSGEPKLNFESIGVAISGNTMTIQIRKSYLYEHSGEVILQIFQETCEQYNILLESNDRLSFVELDIHMDF